MIVHILYILSIYEYFTLMATEKTVVDVAEIRVMIVDKYINKH